jgi:hypothetical protein
MFNLATRLHYSTLLSTPNTEKASVSQGGLGFWLEQAIDFLPGDKPVF